MSTRRCPAAAWGTKNKQASLAFLQRKPYINARVPALLNRCVTGERLRERERERERERVAKLLEWPNNPC